MHTETAGQGPALVLLHGWGMNSRVWQPIQHVLAQRTQITLIDLPGHGLNQQETLGDLDHAVALLKDLIPDNVIIMGWSLGGLVAQALAKALPERVKGLILIASAPRFVASKAWPHAMPAHLLATFGKSLQTDYLGTVKRFFALQFLSTKTDTKVVNALRESIMQQPASKQALEDGLQILATADFTRQPVQQPTLWLLGRLDKLVPESLASALPELGYQRVVLMDGVAHVPFVTHPEQFMQHVEAFLDEC